MPESARPLPGLEHVALLVHALLAPQEFARASERTWSTLLRHARDFNLLGTLAATMHEAAVIPPARAQRHLLGARQLAARQRESVFWEAHQIQRALQPLNVPVVVLKGAAYVLAPWSPPLSPGRLFSDIDVLVPRASLPQVEPALMMEGWVSANTDAYDQRYYREWMHEIPPLQHIHRGTVIDVHHTILPLTARNAPDPAQIIARATPVPGLPALRVPAPEDLVVHSITHLVHEGELHNGLRDLYDIHSMLTRFGVEPAFWQRLLASGAGNDLAGPLVLGLRLVTAVFETAVPAEVLATLDAQAAPHWRRRWWPAVYAQAMRPENDEAAGLTAACARQWIYIRSHALRMPLPLLLRHLSVKAWKGLWPEERPPQAEA